MLAQLETAEDLTITVITNTSGSTVDANTRTFVYRQDGKLNQHIDVLETASSTTITADVTNDATTILQQVQQTLMFPVVMLTLMAKYLNIQVMTQTI